MNTESSIAQQYRECLERIMALFPELYFNKPYQSQKFSANEDTAEQELVTFIRNLGLNVFHYTVKDLEDFSDSEFPMLLVIKNSPVIILSSDANEFTIYNPRTKATETITSIPQAAKLYLFSTQPLKNEPPKNWLEIIKAGFKMDYLKLYFVSFLQNILSLAMPLFVIATYDKVIATESYTLLWSLVAGVIGATIISLIYFYGRENQFQFLQADTQLHWLPKFLNFLYSWPLSVYSKISPKLLVNRMQNFLSVNKYYLGDFKNACLDLPFILIILSLIFILSGALVIIPLCLVVIYLLIMTVQYHYILHKQKLRSKTNNSFLDILNESHQHQQFIAMGGYRDKQWREAKRSLAESIWYDTKVHNFNKTTIELMQALNLISVLAILSFGSLQAMNNTLSLGSLLASMILIWQITAVFKNLVQGIPDLIHHKYNIRQTQKILDYEVSQQIFEQYTKPSINMHDICLNHITYRYPDFSKPTVNDINIVIRAKANLAISGVSMSGKTSLLKLIAGVLEPVAGEIRFGPYLLQDYIKSFSCSPCYLVPSKFIFLNHSLREYLSVVASVPNEQEIWHVFEIFNVAQFLTDSRIGLDTPLNSGTIDSWSAEIKLGLLFSRIIFSQAPVILIDEPDLVVPQKQEQELYANLLTQLANKKTVIFISSKPSVLALSIELVLLKTGIVTTFGKTRDILTIRDAKQ